MTKARTLATFDSTGVLTSASTLNPALLDTTSTIPAALLAGVGGGKIKQVLVKGITGTKTYDSSTVGNGVTVDIPDLSQAITLDSTDNYILALATLSSRLQGAAATTTPSANIFITDATNTGTTIGSNFKGKTYLQSSTFTTNTKEHTDNCTIAAYWTPDAASQTVKLRWNNGSEGGDIQLFDGSKLTLIEITP